MNKKKHAPHPTPPGNRTTIGPATPVVDEAAGSAPGGGEPFSEQDPKRRLGDFETAGEHSIFQPGGKSGGRPKGARK